MKKVLFTIAIAALVASGIFFSVADNPAEAGIISMDSALEIVNDAKTSWGSVNNYKVTFYKAERVDPGDDDDDIVLELLDFKWQKSPERIFIKFLATNYWGHSAGLSMVFPDPTGECDSDEIITNEEGIGTPQCLDPEGDMATMGSRHPVTEAPMGDLINLIVSELTRAKSNPSHGVTVSEAGPTTRIIGGGSLEGVSIPRERVNVKIYEATFPKSQVMDPEISWVSKKGNKYYGHKVEIWFETSKLVPVYVKTTNKNGDWVEKYSFINFSKNSCSASDFDPRQIGGFDVD